MTRRWILAFAVLGVACVVGFVIAWPVASTMVSSKHHDKLADDAAASIFSLDPAEVMRATPDQPPDRYSHWRNQDAALIWRRATVLDFDALSGKPREIEPFLQFVEALDYAKLAEDNEHFSDERICVEICLGVFGHSVMQAEAALPTELVSRMVDASVLASFDAAPNVKGSALAALWALGHRDGDRGRDLDPSVRQIVNELESETEIILPHAEGVWSGFGGVPEPITGG